MNKVVGARGMRDFLPNELKFRQEALNKILQVYKQYGFCQIETPAVENIKYLSNGQGGENEKLVFKILKRNLPSNGDIEEFCDLGLRYDLTLPLARFCLSNFNELKDETGSNIFKLAQTGKVYRAERPQKGRFREFMQCDIDIIGEKSCLAEMELLQAGFFALKSLGLNESDLTLRLNDRRILDFIYYEILGYEEKYKSKVFIILDKLDKIGNEGVRSQIGSLGLDKLRLDKFFEIAGGDAAGWLKEALGTGGKSNELGESMHAAAACALGDIYAITQALHSLMPHLNITLDISLMRGMGYYSGCIFEVAHALAGATVAAGGRYNSMASSLSSSALPETLNSACGFSIGFERVLQLINYKPIKTPHLYLFYNPPQSYSDKNLILLAKQESIASGLYKTVSVQKTPKKLKQFLEDSKATHFAYILDSKALELDATGRAGGAHNPESNPKYYTPPKEINF